MRQQTLAAQIGFERYGRKSKREQFLNQMVASGALGRVTGVGRTTLSEGRERTASGGPEHHAAGVLFAAVVQSERSGCGGGAV